MKTPELLTKRSEIDEMAVRLRAEDAIGIDTEFIRETTFFPKVGLIQIATRSQTWLLDPTVLTKEDLAPLIDVLLDPKILKIMHAAFADQECLYWNYAILAEPVLDTAVAGALCGLGDNIGLAKLLKEILGLNLPKGRARVKWLARPLPRELLLYAEQDVAHLVKLGKTLSERLLKNNRLDWAIAESRLSQSDFEVSPDDIARKIARNGQLDPETFLVLRELISWREERAKTANLPRGWVADNEILVALSKVRPSTIDDLRSFRGLNAKELDRNGEKILAAIRKGLAAPKEDLKLPQRMVIPNDHENHALDLLKAYVAYLAAQHEIAPKFLLQSQKSMALLLNSQREPEEWVEREIITQSARALVGEDLKALLNGKRALVLNQGKVEILAV